MINNSKVLYMFFLIFILSCAHNNIAINKPVMIGEELFIKVDSFTGLFNNKKSLKQLIHYTREGETKSVIVVFKKRKASSLNISVLSLHGVELLALEVTHRKIRRLRGISTIDSAFFKKVMGEMLITYSTREKLKLILSEGAEIVDNNAQRSINYRQNKVIKISYSDKNLWPTDVFIENFVQKYTLRIKNLEN